MHETLLPSIKGNIDRTETTDAGTIKIIGWAFDAENNQPLDSIRVILQSRNLPEGAAANFDMEEYSLFVERNDVAEFYEDNSIVSCGINWEFEDNDYIMGELQTLVSDQWKTFRLLQLKNPKPEEIIEDVTIKNQSPSVVIVENFYSDPDAVREYAQTLTFEESGYHKGKRTQGTTTIFEGTKEFFEKALGKKITKWGLWY